LINGRQVFLLAQNSFSDDHIAYFEPGAAANDVQSTKVSNGQQERPALPGARF
jgi:hypothetical protein